MTRYVTQNQMIIEEIQKSFQPFVEENKLDWRLLTLKEDQLLIQLTTKHADELCFFEAKIIPDSGNLLIDGHIRYETKEETIHWYDYCFLAIILIIIIIPYALFLLFYKLFHFKRKTDQQWLNEYFLSVLNCKKV